jgi:hypothetical protein
VLARSLTRPDLSEPRVFADHFQRNDAYLAGRDIDALSDDEAQRWVTAGRSRTATQSSSTSTIISSIRACTRRSFMSRSGHHIIVSPVPFFDHNLGLATALAGVSIETARVAFSDRHCAAVGCLFERKHNMFVGAPWPFTHVQHVTTGAFDASPVVRTVNAQGQQRVKNLTRTAWGMTRT